MSYRIVIEKIEVVEEMERGQHTVIGEEPVADRTDYRKVYGYAPDRLTKKERTTKLFEQTLDEIDIPKFVIAANS